MGAFELLRGVWAFARRCSAEQVFELMCSWFGNDDLGQGTLDFTTSVVPVVH